MSGTPVGKMVIPVNEIEALLEYIVADIENGVQMNSDEWQKTVDTVRTWLSINVPTTYAPDRAFCPDCDTVSVDKKCPFCGGVLVTPREAQKGK